MSKQFKSSARDKVLKIPAKGKLSLHPLTLETAMGAALQTGRYPGEPDKKSRKRPVDKRRGK